MLLTLGAYSVGVDVNIEFKNGRLNNFTSEEGRRSDKPSCCL